MLRNRHLMMHHLMKNNVPAPTVQSSTISSPGPLMDEPKLEPVVEIVTQVESPPDEVKEISIPETEVQENKIDVPSAETLPQQVEDVVSYKTEETKKKVVGVKSKIV